MVGPCHSLRVGSILARSMNAISELEVTNLSDVDEVLAVIMPQLVVMQSELAFHEDTVTTLNEAVARQQQEIMTLQRQLTLLKQRQDAQTGQTDGGGGDLADEKPPHY